MKESIPEDGLHLSKTLKSVVIVDTSSDDDSDDDELRIILSKQ